jgi:sterol O-acyltransferase
MVFETRSLITKTRLSHNKTTDNVTTTTSSAMAVAVMATNARFNKQRQLFFKARNTAFDTTEAHKETFRGFYTVFWLAMLVYSIQTFMSCYQQEGILLSLRFFRLFSKDAWTLLVSDMVMVSFTLLSVPFSKILVKGVLRYDTTGVLLQHLGQALFLFGNIYWVFWR